jgi:hypothetical protein
MAAKLLRLACVLETVTADALLVTPSEVLGCFMEWASRAV